ncbi:hypothetical protein [Microlunatus parietis]|uniref:Uncharacterized protein n=1 Tax=Microlunatus parietis TaxID=682979 RepID=A0A7Y9I9C5_9ACTN|nr:hypothetical protein [Microlunatus parietis]NYE72708.1 hypothetical protein [Microlunatus parietis]
MPIGGAGDDAGDLVLAEVLIHRGWSSIIDGQVWEWRGSRPAAGAFAPGACVLVDDDLGGYVVEGPSQRDEPTDILRYRSRRDLLTRLRVIENWTLPLTAGEVDAEHAEAS